MTAPTTAHFLTDIEIKEFKCFKDFKASGFKRVNLIGGKNNVGKTAFMEACYINTYSHSHETVISVICDIEFNRTSINLVGVDKYNIDYNKMLDSVKYYSSIGTYKNDSKPVNFYITETKSFGKNYCTNVWGSETSFEAPLHKPEAILENIFGKGIIFISGFGWSNELISTLYQFVQINDEEELVNKFVNEFDNNIEAIKIIGDIPKCKINGIYHDIVEFGDGLKHFISIIFSLFACKKGCIFIDEIDNGIYYEHFDSLWEIILTLSKKTNCQIFATTHSKEMLESFARVAKKLDEQDVSYTRLIRNKKQELKSITFDYEVLEYSLENEHEVR